MRLGRAGRRFAGKFGSSEAIECRGDDMWMTAPPRVVEWIVDVLEQGHGGLGVERG
jgi:hypothetical protein